MKVVLSIDPVRHPLTGVGRYTYELAQRLCAARLESLCFLRGGEIIRAPDSVPISQPRGSGIPLRGWVSLVPFAIPAFRRFDGQRKRRALRNLSDHVYHGPGFYLPDFAGPRVVTIHDLSMFIMEENHSPERISFMRGEIAKTIERADFIITDTEYTRQEIAEFFDWPLNNIRAIHLAAGPQFHPRTETEVCIALSPLGLSPGSYCLFVGTIEPRKNLDVLLDAYAGLPKALRDRVPLVVAGYRGWLSDRLHARMERAESAGWLRYLQFVPENMLPLLMAGAVVFSFPSKYEGFGLPVMEAMASGVPVISSNASCLPEVGGDAPAYHAPEDVEGLRGLLERALKDPKWRAAAVSSSLERARAFSWDRCARETLAVYEELAGA